MKHLLLLEKGLRWSLRLTSMHRGFKRALDHLTCICPQSSHFFTKLSNIYIYLPGTRQGERQLRVVRLNYIRSLGQIRPISKIQTKPMVNPYLLSESIHSALNVGRYLLKVRKILIKREGFNMQITHNWKDRSINLNQRPIVRFKELM